MRSKILFAVLAFVVTGTAMQAAQTVLCYSCGGPTQSEKCSFNGREGTWGSPVTINGVTYQVCNIPSIVVIRQEDAFVTDAQVQAHALRISRFRDVRVPNVFPQTQPEQFRRGDADKQQQPEQVRPPKP